MDLLACAVGAVAQEPRRGLVVRRNDAAMRAGNPEIEHVSTPGWESEARVCVSRRLLQNSSSGTLYVRRGRRSDCTRFSWEKDGEARQSGSLRAMAAVVRGAVDKGVNVAATIDNALTGSMVGQWLGWDTATGWMATVERHARVQRGEATASRAAPPSRPASRPVALQRTGTNSRSTNKLRSTISTVADNLVDLGDAASSKLSRAPRRQSREADDAKQQHDPMDPSTWTDVAMQAYLVSYPALAPSGSDDRQDLIRRCCVALGRPYHAPHSADATPTPPPARPPPAHAPPPPRVGAAGTGGQRGSSASSSAQGQGVAAATRASIVMDDELTRSESMQLFAQMNAAVEPIPLASGHPAKLAAERTKRRSREHSREHEQQPPPQQHPTDPSGLRQSKERHSRPTSANARGGASPSKHPAADRPVDGSGRRGGGHGRGGSATSGGSSGRSGSASKSRSRQSDTPLRRGAPPSPAAGDGDAGGAQAAAAKRVGRWAKGKDFVAMINTLGEMIEVNNDASIAPLPASGASVAALKKAFHRASKSLHPDKLRALPGGRRAEAEELFKVVSAAYHECEAMA